MATVAAPVAYELLVVSILSWIAEISIVIIHISPNVLHLVQLPVHPIFFCREISQGLEGEIQWSDKTLNVSESAGRTFWAETQNVVHANFLMDIFWSVIELTEISTYLTETSLVIGTEVHLFRRPVIGLLRMSVDALGVLQVTMTVLFEEFAYWNFVLHVSMQVLALVSLSTNFFEPVHAHFCLALSSVGLRAH